MDNINQAFMRVYSKRRPNAEAGRPDLRTDDQPDASPVEQPNDPTALRRTVETGTNAKHWRFDSPATASDASVHEQQVPAPHAAFAAVQHVETYDLESIQGAPAQGRVVLNDHMAPHRSAQRETDPAQTQATTDGPPETGRGADLADGPNQDQAPVPWVFALDVQRLDNALEPKLNAQPIAALDAPAELGDAPRDVCIASSVARAMPDHSHSGQEIPAVAEPAPTMPESSAPVPESVASPAAPSPSEVNSAPEVSMPRIADPAEMHADPSLHADEAPLDDALSPEQLSQRAIDMDAAPSVPFPEPEWPAEALSYDSVIASAEPPAASFSPAWEVDQFFWPDICQRLERALDDALKQSGEALYEATRDELRVLGITSAERREGRTTLALALARSVARAGARVALLDADLANPDAARQLGIEAPCSWADTVVGAQPLSEAAVLSLEDNVTLLPLTTPLDDAPHRPARRQLAETVRRARDDFDLVILDMQPVDARDVSAFQEPAECPIDMAIVVRNINTTSEDQTLEAVARLHAMGVPAVGIAENFTPKKSA